MKRTILAALLLAACGGSETKQTTQAVTGCWTITLTKPDGSTLCTGAMNLIEKDGAISGAWNCETGTTGSGYGGHLEGQRVNGALFLDLEHEVGSWAPWVGDVDVSADGKTASGDLHGWELYRLAATLG